MEDPMNLRPVLLSLLLIAGCSPTEPSPQERCDVAGALNRGSQEPCRFSRVAFYVSRPAAFPVTVSIDGNQVQTAISGYWPIGPGNCSAEYTAQTVLSDGRMHDWNARAVDGRTWSGTLQANSSQECLRIQIF
jgi:hypothetical protein